MKLLDTNIFVYAEGQSDPLREPCRAMLGIVRQDPGAYNVDVELLQEILHLYHARRQDQIGFRIFDALSLLFPNPIQVTIDAMGLARRLLERYPGLEARDAVHAGVTLAFGLEGLITTDKGFKQVNGLHVWDPRELV